MTYPALAGQIARTHGFTVGEPSGFWVDHRGESVLFLRSRAGDDPVQLLWALDTEDGTERILIDPAELSDGAEELPPEELTRRERERVTAHGVVGFAADPAGRAVACALSGGVWVTDRWGATPRRLATQGGVVDPRPDPTGQHLAYVSAGSLWVVGVDGSGDRMLAGGDGPDVTWGLPEHVAAESMDRTRGFWWSPDGRRLLVARADTSRVDRWYITDPAEPSAPPRAVRYPAAGTANAEVTLWLVDLDGRRTPVPWDTGSFEYLTAAGWDEHGPMAAVQSRDQHHLQVLAVDPADGSTRVVADQHQEPWVHLVGGVPARLSDGRLVLVSDVDGWRRLLVEGAPVSPSGVNVREVLSVGSETVLFTGWDEPTELHVWRHGPTGCERLSAVAGVHTAASGGSTLVHTASTLDQFGPVTTVYAEGRAPAVIGTVAHRPQPRPRMTLVTAGERDLRTALFWPTWHEAGQRLPVLMDPYGGPHGQKVLARLAGWTATSQFFAELGFAVIVTDGRGTPGRGPAWEHTVWGAPDDPALTDQVDALHHLGAVHPDLDLGRVGIRGWSYGGYLAALAVLRRPDVFHAAVAGAPVTDTRLYDTHWQERYLGHPAEHPEHYDRSTITTEAANLTRPLLLIHGLADDNVVPAHTLRLSAALLAAGRPHEVLPLTRASHMLADAGMTEHLLWHEADFLRRELGVAGRP